MANGTGIYTPPSMLGDGTLSSATFLRGDSTYSTLTSSDIPAVLDSNARVAIRKNTGADTGTRRRLNFIEGSNVTLTLADDSGSEEVDITIAAAGGGGDSITVNGVAVVDADFDNATPAAGAGAQNVVWQKDAGSPANISAYLQYSTIPLSGFAVPIASVDFEQQQAVQLCIENRTSDPGTPATGEIWLRTDL